LIPYVIRVVRRGGGPDRRNTRQALREASTNAAAQAQCAIARRYSPRVGIRMGVFNA
jgi:hypothetical protein